MAPKRNGFWYFMAEYRRQEEAKGRTFPGGFREVQEDLECSKRWRSLTDGERAKYNARARKDNGGRPKLTCWGEPIEAVQAREKRRAEYEENMRQDIQKTVELARMAKTLTDVPFYFIHSNYFYAKEALDTSLTYIPAEFAVCEFTIAGGCKRFYHQIINITVELGYARETMEHAEETHRLSPDYSKGEKDYRKILQKFQEFLEPELVRTGKMPPVYTTMKNYGPAKCFLDKLVEIAASADWTGHKEVSNLYKLEILVGKLMVASNPDLLSHSCNPTILAEAELEKGAFAYTPNIECGFHQRIEGASIHCSLGIVRQWVFLICDYCCHRLGVKMVKEVHCPADIAYDDVDLLVSHMSDLDLVKERRVGYVKSATGVTQAYRESKAGRTPAQEERRRREAMKAPPLTIIDHGQLLKPATSMTSLASSASDSCRDGYLKPLRVPKTLAVTVKGSPNSPPLDDTNFPTMSNARKLISSRILAVRGRGGVPAAN